MSTTAPDPWLRPSVAARRLGITMQTLRRWMSKGVIAYSLVGPNNYKRLRLSEVDSHLTSAGAPAIERCYRGIYFIAAADRIKIGKSASVRDRFLVLQTGSPVVLEPVGFIPCATAGEAEQLESSLHEVFAAFRTHGEWFMDCSELRTFIQARAVAWPSRYVPCETTCNIKDSY